MLCFYSLNFSQRLVIMNVVYYIAIHILNLIKKQYGKSIVEIKVIILVVKV